ncbi:MAG: bifunctional UDP-N-acetylmuramoyl-tripeptide:D-alanyl-D-alanine ligase/alanine racemase [Flavobacteriales bacterium]|nr:bifunctional UDP-N-acetylmuramoyl-tripeptide:D-alanyl-D-alanine ligase/alanine racemase [Flavobacteriales bacterium]
MTSLSYHLDDIVSCCGGKVAGENTSTFSDISIDTRKLYRGEQTLYIALKGLNHDGHAYLQAAYDKGVRAFMVSQLPTLSDFPGAGFHVSEDTLSTWQKWVGHHRSQFQIPVIGITGSNGKTVVKEWLNQLLAGTRRIARSPKSFNSQSGVPLSVWQLQPEHELALFEAGISRPGEMSALEQVIRPTMGIFTNLGSAHMEHFGSRQDLANEKAGLFAHCTEVICSDHYPEIIKAIRRHAPNTKLVTWGTAMSDYPAGVLDDSLQHTSLYIQCGIHREVFDLPFHDEASRENALHCIVMLLRLGYAPNWIAERVRSLVSVEMRLETIAGKQGCILVNDAYSTDEQSLHIALDHLKVQSRGLPMQLIVSEFEQSGIEVERQARMMERLAGEYRLEHVYMVGSHVCQLEGTGPVQYFESTDALISTGLLQKLEGRAILIKGARKFAFERITRLMQEKTHDTVLEIDLDAMQHNLNAFRSHVNPGVCLMVMVKAQGYGTGSVDIARFLEFNRVDYLGVAYTDEGVELRNKGISLPIMVMNPERGSLETLIAHRLEPEIYSLETLERFVGHLANAALKAPFPIHLKFDTGMHRLGFEEAHIMELIQRLKAASQVRIASVFTHLAGSDAVDLDGFTRSQVDQFVRMADQLQEALGYSFTRHVVNSAGIVRFPQFQFDMVRLGIGIYGIGSGPEPELKPVARLKTIISQIKTIAPGESVGYSRSFVAEAQRRIATIPVGYADGLFRALGNGVGWVNIQGKSARIVGNVCMDMCMVDITDIPCKVGDAVEVFGDNPTITHLANAAHTIPYEILSTVSSRVKRVYLKEEV